MKIDIQETINRLRELDKNASPAPWKYAVIHLTDEDSYSQLEEARGEHILDNWGTSQLSYEDIDIIIEARNAIPVLLTEIERLKAENKKLSEAWEGGYKFAANSYYDDISEPDDFAQEARANSPYKEEK